jgi:acetamidase/formamidase
VRSFHLSSSQRHLAWDNTLEPAVIVAPGDEVVLELVDSSGGQIARGDDASVLARLDLTAVNPCTGPVAVDGAQPGDVVVVDVLDLDTADWAWTANIPGFGLLADDFPHARLWGVTVRDGVVHLPFGAELAARPMIGTIGVAPAEPGTAPLLVPTDAGGNMDIAQLGAGARLHLPVRVPGALLSVGDAHAVQGDGEVCGTGAETPATVRLRIGLERGPALPSPWFSHQVRRAETAWTATTGIGPDLLAAARDATRRAVDLVSGGSGVDPVDAYLLLSLVGELRVAEVVDAPNWVVTMHVPQEHLA